MAQLINKSRLKVGLVLGSGGAKGMAHIGVIKTLIKEGIPIDSVVGSSVGAIVGGMFCQSQDIESFAEKLLNIDSKIFYRCFRDLSLRAALVKGDNMMDAFRQLVGQVNIEDLAIPYRAVATNLITGLPVIFDQGELALAMRASSSIPPLFEPTKLNGKRYIDGGASMPIPVPVARNLGADLVIAVNLNTNPAKQHTHFRFNPMSLTSYSIRLLQYHLSQDQVKAADIIISPELPVKISLKKMLDAQSLVEAGVVATELIMPKLKELLANT